MKTIFTIQNLKTILLGTSVGYLIGWLISYINLFGSSQNEQLICAIGGMAFTVASLRNKKLLQGENNSSEENI